MQSKIMHRAVLRSNYGMNKLMGLLETQYRTCLSLKTMSGFPENASENGKPGVKIKGNSEEKELTSSQPKFPFILQIWLRLHYLMTMTEE